ncbi:MAG: hypothetical protein FWC60_02400, partial [Firmicutes bacterium]|nr:hypothetical protein [Bacillota bacterium]
PAASLMTVIKREGGATLQEVRLFDVYQGEQVAEGYRSIAFALRFQAYDRTLTDEEVAGKMAHITAALEKEQGALLREKNS